MRRDMTSDDLKRYSPLAAIVAVFLIVVIVLLTGGGDEQSAEQSVAEKPAAKAVAKQPIVTAATGATAGVTPQSTEKVSGPHDDPVPILMYHVTKAAPPAGTPYPELWVSPADFKGQMNWLADNGYTGITMAQLFNYWDDGFKLPEKPVVISFDDGYPSHAKTARPVLAGHKWPGVLFLKLGNVNNPESGLSASHVKSLLASGWELGSHTIDHSDLTTLSASELEVEVADSKEQISDKFGVPIEFFCYPAGKFDATVVAAVEAAGYKGATTVLDGLATPDKPYELKRIRINGNDGVDGFASKLRAAEQ
ncbi:MAG: polysaccharide deacetylase family protein [Thermoleophilaceae bacterium]|nr:polysaccharide deacetylase family protein [Thermoleophilaceae bacterium]